MIPSTAWYFYTTTIAGGATPETAYDLFEAIWLACDADSGLTTSFGRSDWLWVDEAPADEPFPLAVISNPEGVRTEYESPDDTGTVELTTFRLPSLSVYATTRASARDLLLSILNVIEDASLPFDDGRDGVCLYLRHGDINESLDPDRGPDGADIWQATTILTAITSHTL